MAPIAKIFHNLPELSDDFRRLLKDLMDSAPDELPSTQVRVAADLTDTPYDEGLRRMAEYADMTPLSKDYTAKPATTILYQNPEREDRLVEKLGRELTETERERLGASDSWASMRKRYGLDSDADVTNPRLVSFRNLLATSTLRPRPRDYTLADVTGDRQGLEQLRSFFNINREAAAENRKEFQRRMALEYLLEGFL